MTDTQKQGFGLWLIIAFMALIFTSIYQVIGVEDDLWLREIIWWCMAATLLVSAVGLGLLLWSFWPVITNWLKEIGTERKEQKNREVQRRVDEFDRLIKKMGKGQVLARETVNGAAIQAASLANIIVSLHKRAHALHRKMEAYNAAVKALLSGDKIAIARCAGKVDQDFRTIMTTPLADAPLYQILAQAAAERASDAERWLVDYKELRDDLIVQLTGISTRMQMIRAHGDMAIASAPLLRAEKHIGRAFVFLKLGVHQEPTSRIEEMKTLLLED